MCIRGSSQTQNILNSFDFSAIDEMDPTLHDGNKLIFDRELQFHIRFQEKGLEAQELSSLEPIRVRVLLLGDETNPQQIKLELSSENDLFFYYQHIANDSNFKEIKKNQQLHIDFSEYAVVIIKSLNKCEKEPNQFCAIFTIFTDGLGRLEIVQTMEYKDIELIAFDFAANPEEAIRQQITFRYGALKSKLALMEGRLQDIHELVRLKNPSLLLQMQKVPQASRMSYNSSCLLYTSPSPRDRQKSRMPSSA
eukprot:TRINITY_DN2526_c0_g1_i1.p1 TRINITY_DN2526_c0_g1~~TRINITY_DN2526_c0_g1_i1.p1  ORF type:complete len:251 (+),score=49.95 TRINITY_DN2526_c0_g1_i1:63-815(+)